MTHAAGARFFARICICISAVSVSAAFGSPLFIVVAFCTVEVCLDCVNTKKKNDDKTSRGPSKSSTISDLGLPATKHNCTYYIALGDIIFV